jgi:hypothetical protein
LRRFALVLAAVAAMLVGSTGVADAMADPFPTCIRDCSPIPELPPIIVCVTEPCP